MSNFKIYIFVSIFLITGYRGLGQNYSKLAQEFNIQKISKFYITNADTNQIVFTKIFQNGDEIEEVTIRKDSLAWDTIKISKIWFRQRFVIKHKYILFKDGIVFKTDSQSYNLPDSSKTLFKKTWAYPYEKTEINLKNTKGKTERFTEGKKTYVSYWKKKGKQIKYKTYFRYDNNDKWQITKIRAYLNENGKIIKEIITYPEFVERPNIILYFYNSQNLLIRSERITEGQETQFIIYEYLIR